MGRKSYRKFNLLISNGYMNIRNHTKCQSLMKLDRDVNIHIFCDGVVNQEAIN